MDLVREPSDGGNVAAIVAQAHAAGVSTLFIKSSDGSTNYWSQFSPQLVAELHAAGLKVCAWQYVYGTNPAGEAALGAEAATTGADCLVIDAEAEYEGHYAAAQTYITDLRAKIGADYPLALASFPYVSYHPIVPLLGVPRPRRGAVQRAADVLARHRRVGGHGVRQHLHRQPHLRASDLPAGPDLRRRVELRTSALPRGGRRLRRHGLVLLGLAGNQLERVDRASPRRWRRLPPCTPNTTYPELSSGSKGDQVLWMQEHLASAVAAQETTGIFDSQTAADLRVLPDRARDSRHGRDRRRHLDGAAGAARRGGGLDRRRSERGLSAAREAAESRLCYKAGEERWISLRGVCGESRQLVLQCRGRSQAAEAALSR